MVKLSEKTKSEDVANYSDPEVWIVKQVQFAQTIFLANNPQKPINKINQSQAKSMVWVNNYVKIVDLAGKITIVPVVNCSAIEVELVESEK